MSSECGNNPWDPRCNKLPKPEVYTAFCPFIPEYNDEMDYKTFLTYDKAKDWINEHHNGMGLIHKHSTEIVYFSKEENKDGQ